eukprot:1984177-Amphidinium_carterae.1
MQAYSRTLVIQASLLKDKDVLVKGGVYGQVVRNREVLSNAAFCISGSGSSWPPRLSFMPLEEVEVMTQQLPLGLDRSPTDGRSTQSFAFLWRYTKGLFQATDIFDVGRNQERLSHDTASPHEWTRSGGFSCQSMVRFFLQPGPQALAKAGEICHNGLLAKAYKHSGIHGQLVHSRNCWRHTNAESNPVVRPSLYFKFRAYI